MLDNPFHENIFPNIWTKPPLVQLHVVSSCPLHSLTAQLQTISLASLQPWAWSHPRRATGGSSETFPTSPAKFALRKRLPRDETKGPFGEDNLPTWSCFQGRSSLSPNPPAKVPLNRLGWAWEWKCWRSLILGFPSRCSNAGGGSVITPGRPGTIVPLIRFLLPPLAQAIGQSSLGFNSD